jgi:sulfite exporter TauE/SafE/copper chaperone CopZ
MNEDQNLRKIKLKIHGMHCASCEVLIERKFKKINGVEKVSVSHHNGKAELYCKFQPNLKELGQAVKADGYSVSLWENHKRLAVIDSHKNTGQDYMEIGMIFLLVMALYLIFSSLDLLPKGLGVTSNMGYGLVFVIGLVAAVSSCIAVTGGMLLAVAAKYNEMNPNLNGAQRFKPHLYFNAGRIISYTLLGGAIGALGSVFKFSPQATGFITIVASIVMILFGFQVLNLFPWLRRFQPRMPKFLAHRIHGASESQHKTAPFLLGAATFFLPCGFTQALQLYVLSKGSFTVGALTMLVFSLGTLPALLSLSAISSFAKGAFQRYFLKFAGVVVILLGLFNINNGLTLTGSNFNLSSLFQSSGSSNVAQAATVPIVDGKQVVKMKVQGYTYSPAQFNVVAGVPIEWQIDGSQAEGCAQVVISPSLNLSVFLPRDGVKTVEFTPTKTGTFPFSCSMGMTTRGAAFNVLANAQQGNSGGVVKAVANNNNATAGDTDNPNAQQLSMTISSGQGFYPNQFTVKKGLAAQLNIDAQTVPGGCMSVMVIPKFNVAHQITQGKNIIAFNPGDTGTFPITCSMGGRIGQITVTD